MRYIRTYKLPALLTIFILSVFLFSCSDDMEGVFYSLEIEEKVKDNSLPNKATITGDIIRVDKEDHPGSGEDRYYLAAGGNVYYRNVGGGDWTRIPPPFTGAMVHGIALAGPGEDKRIFVAASNVRRHGLFMLNSAGTAYETYYDSGGPIGRLISLNNYLFAAVGDHQNLPRDLLYLDGSGLASAGTTELGRTVRAGWVVGTKYWFVGHDVFYFNGTPGSWNFPDQEGAPDRPPNLENLTGLCNILVDPDDPDTIYICTDSGYLAKTTNGGTSWDNPNHHSYKFTSIAKIKGSDPNSGTTKSKIILALKSGGVVEVDPKNLSLAPESPKGNFKNLPDLKNATVKRLLGDGAQLLVGTSNQGAWRGDYSDINSPVWYRE